MTSAVLALVLAAPAAGTPSFTNDVVPLLTKLGCNQGACHGKGAGQNGFRLSLRGYAPEQDHLSITREFSGRRISTAVPEQSQLLTRPLGQAAHEGGKLFGEGSREHELLLDWITAGCPGPKKEDVTLRALTLKPGHRTARVGDTLPLAVEAEFSDGSRRDVTWLSRFDSNDPGVAEVSPGGEVRVKREGETAIRASYQTLVSVLIVSVPYTTSVKPEAFTGRTNFIDDHVFAKLKALDIEPSGPCDDATFLRRAFLDALGTLPTAEEVKAFLADQSSDKRAKVIESLLVRPEFVDYWALQLGDLMQNRKERDHDVRGTKGVRAFHEWLRQQVAANRPWDQLARDVLTATGKTSENPAVGYYVVTVGEHREAHKSEVTASVAQAFLGTRIGCAQCHNHPLERYTQDDYYHFAAFFSRVKLDRKEPNKAPTMLTVGHPDKNQDRNPVGVPQPRTGQFMKPQPLDRSPTDVKPGDDPRIKLAEWMTDPKNEAFSGAMVNRIWRHYLGVGLVEPVDDLRASNPPSNPGLWKALNEEFVGHQFDLKHLMKVILNSRTYQLAATTRPGNAADTRFYSHFMARRLPSEVLLDAVCQATGVPESFPGYPVGVRAIQLPDPGVRSYFLSLFGRSDRVTACACERNGEVTLPQLLHVNNGAALIDKIKSGDGRLVGLLKSGQPDAEVIEKLFLTTLGRPPRPAELETINRELARKETRDAFFRDLFWALLNTKEFAFNH